MEDVGRLSGGSTATQQSAVREAGDACLQHQGRKEAAPCLCLEQQRLRMQMKLYDWTFLKIKSAPKNIRDDCNVLIARHLFYEPAVVINFDLFVFAVYILLMFNFNR